MVEDIAAGRERKPASDQAIEHNADPSKRRPILAV